jgi:hypothetical protein
MNDSPFPSDVCLSHSAKDKAVVPGSRSASTGERAGVRCRSPRLAGRLQPEGPAEFGLRTSDFPSPCGTTTPTETTDLIPGYGTRRSVSKSGTED